ncbi:MAG: hypothetical protein ACRD1L_08675 [Terriglobales bacterium]
MHELTCCQPRVAIFDVLGEHPSPNVFSDLDDCLDYLEAMARAPRFHCAYRPLAADLAGDLNDLAEAVFNRVGGCLLALEEVPWYSSASAQPEGLDMLTRMGRHRRVDLVWTAQRLAEVSRRLTAATDVFVIFGMREPRDLAALEDRCGRDVALQVQRLGQHERLVYDVIKGKAIVPSRASTSRDGVADG